MSEIKNEIILFGGLGYVGSGIIEYFNSKDINVSVIDNNIYGKNIIKTDGNQYIFADTRNINLLSDYDYSDKYVVVLSGLVGDPITSKYPELSIEINETSLIKLINTIKNFKKLIFISTCSNYGLSSADNVLDETADLNPISIYSKSKVAVENYLINSNINYTILRFATAFGHSSNMRFDLTLNEFTAKQYFDRYLEVYDYETYRPYCHIKDFAQAILKVINCDDEITKQEIFNVGSNENNISKVNLISLIAENLESSNYKLIDDSKDRRNYVVNFSKVESVLEFRSSYTIEDGIKEIISKLEINEYGLDENFDLLNNYYGNYSIPKSTG